MKKNKTILCLVVALIAMFLATNAFACGCNAKAKTAAVAEVEAAAEQAKTNKYAAQQPVPTSPQQAAVQKVASPQETYDELVSSEGDGQNAGKEETRVGPAETREVAPPAVVELQKTATAPSPISIAVHTLLAMETTAVSIGPQISQVAKEFNNSIQQAIVAEEKIQNRAKVSTLLFGGDIKAAEQIEQAIAQNNARVLQMARLVEQCTDCSPQARESLQQQIQQIEQEQARLSALAQKEKTKKGILSWLFSKRQK